MLVMGILLPIIRNFPDVFSASNIYVYFFGHREQISINILYLKHAFLLSAFIWILAEQCLLAA